MPKIEIVTRPVPSPTDPATREWVEALLDRRLDRALKTSEEVTNKIVCGFAARLFKQFPRAIALAIAEVTPNSGIDSETLTTALESIFTSDLKRAN